MFNKLKQYKDMRGQAKTLQNALAEEKVTIEKGGITLTMDGNQKVLEVKIDRSLTAEKIEKILPGVLEDATKKVQRKMMMTMQKMGGLDKFGIGGQ
jgi:DNA-binding protein YbaB